MPLILSSVSNEQERYIGLEQESSLSFLQDSLGTTCRPSLALPIEQKN